MEIKKGNRFVCVEDVVMEGVHDDVTYIKGNVYTSESDNCITNENGNSGHRWKGDGEEKYFIPYSKLDMVYTKHTPLLEKIFDNYDGKKSATSGKCATFFDNVTGGGETGWLVSTSSIGDGYYKDEGFTYLSEQAFIEFMGLNNTPDAVNNPSHYNNGSIEPIDYITANSMNFLEGNVVKYVTRYKFKNGLEDLKKAEFYLNKLIEGYKS